MIEYQLNSGSKLFNLPTIQVEPVDALSDLEWSVSGPSDKVTIHEGQLKVNNPAESELGDNEYNLILNEKKSGKSATQTFTLRVFCVTEVNYTGNSSTLLEYKLTEQAKDVDVTSSYSLTPANCPNHLTFSAKTKSD